MATAHAEAAVTRPIRVASYDIPSSRVMAEVYARALRENGQPAELTVAGTDGAILGAMQAGAIDVLPVYVSSYADWLDATVNGTEAGKPLYDSASAAAEHASEHAQQFGIDVLPPSAGGDTQPARRSATPLTRRRSTSSRPVR